MELVDATKALVVMFSFIHHQKCESTLIFLEQKGVNNFCNVECLLSPKHTLSQLLSASLTQPITQSGRGVSHSTKSSTGQFNKLIHIRPR